MAAVLDHEGPHVFHERPNLTFQIRSEACGTAHGQHRHRKLGFSVLPVVLSINLVSAEVSDACAQRTRCRQLARVLFQHVILQCDGVVGLLPHEMPNKHLLAACDQRFRQPVWRFKER